MKKTWIVTVGQPIGHEFCGAHSEMEIYGPYTEAVAKKLAADLTNWLDTGDSEVPIVSAEPIVHLSPKEVLREYRSRSIDEEPKEI